MYPSIRFSIIQKAVTYYTSHLHSTTRNEIRTCLKTIEFGMASYLITFDDKYCKYKGEGDNNDRGLAIGRYKSAFLADLVTSYLLEKITQKFFEHNKFYGIYYNGSFVVFDGKKNFDDFQTMLINFQHTIDKFTGVTYLQFTLGV